MAEDPKKQPAPASNPQKRTEDEAEKQREENAPQKCHIERAKIERRKE